MTITNKNNNKMELFLLYLKSVTERMSVDETPIHTLNDTIKY